MEAVSRRVGELALEWIRGQGSSWSTRRLNELEPCPRIHYTSGADVTGYPRYLWVHHGLDQSGGDPRARPAPEATIVD